MEKRKIYLMSLHDCFLSAEKLPVDKVNGNFVRTVKNCIFSRSTPTPLRGPLRLAAVSKVKS